MNILVSGASGYIGRNLIQTLLTGSAHQIVAGVHNTEKSKKLYGSEPRVRVSHLDVLSPDSLDRSLKGIDIAYYFVHLLNRDDFITLESRAARNFLEACENHGVKRIIYLSGLGSDEVELSDHIKSRHEVGFIFRESMIPNIEFRASIILGKGGLSYELLRNLVVKLPVMLLPTWCRTLTQPIALPDVMRYLVAALYVTLDKSWIVPIGGPETMTYVDMIRHVAALLDKKPLLITTPVLSAHLSAKWLDLFTPGQAKVGKHMVDSLKHKMIVDSTAAQELFPIIHPAPPFQHLQDNPGS